MLDGGYVKMNRIMARNKHRAGQQALFSVSVPLDADDNTSKLPNLLPKGGNFEAVSC